MEDNENNVEKSTYTPEEVEEIKAQIKKENEEAFDKKFNTRWGKAMNKFEKEHEKDNELINLLKQQTGKQSIDDLLNFSYETYGVERPVNDKDSQVLGEYDAQELINLNDLSEIESEVERLSNMKRTVREEATFNKIESYLNERKKEEKIKNEIKEAGLEENILEEDSFKNFMGKFREDIPIKDIYNDYLKLNPKEKPYSTGSLKDVKAKSSELFTKEEFMALTSEDLKNPVIFEKAMKSKKYFK